MLRSGNDLQLEFLAETDFRSVITVDRHFLKDGEEIVLHQSIPAGGLPEWRAVLVHGTSDSGGLIEGSQENKLLLGRSSGEILSEKRVALLVHAGEAGEKITALFVVGPFAEDDVNEFI